MNTAELLEVNLVEKNKNNQILKNNIEDFKIKNADKITFENKELNLKAGDVVNVIAGYNSDINYKVEIFSFDKKSGEAYLVWDCYWFTKKINK